MEAWEKVSVENHDLSKELKRLKRDLDDTCATLDEQKRQNKSMGDENQNLSKFRSNFIINYEAYNTPGVPLFCTPPFFDTAPFFRHFFEEFMFCLYTPLFDTTEKMS